jgi:hypothetical protein
MQSKILSLVFFLLLAVCAAAQTTVKPTTNNEVKEETCVVSGIVVRKADSVPLKGATVQLVNGEDRENTIATKTGPDGHFELRNVPAGQYRFKAMRNGYVEYEYGQKKTTDPGATFTLRAGQRMMDLIFKLARAGVLTGKIYDDDGEPMAGAMVSALRQIYKDGRKQFETTTADRSNDLGEYRLHGLAPGRYYVSAQPQTWNRVIGDREFSGTEKNAGEKGYARIYYPNATDPTRATNIEVKEGEEVPSLDILMKEMTVYRVRGRVWNLNSKHGSRETALQVMRRNGKVDWEFLTGASVSKTDGTFEIPEMAPGEYTVLAFWGDEGKMYSTQEDVDVVNADVDGLILSIAPGVNIAGQVNWEGKASLDWGEMSIGASPVQSGFMWVGMARVNEAQQFTLKDVPQGVFRLEIEGLSKDCYIKEVRQGENLLSDDIFRVARGAAIPLEVTVSSRGAKVEGTVTNEDSLPVAGVWVVAVPEEAKRKQHRLFKSETTDQFGHFSLRGLAPGKYRLFSWDGAERGAWVDEDFIKPFEEKGVTVEVADGDAKAADLILIQLQDAAIKN